MYMCAQGSSVWAGPMYHGSYKFFLQASSII